MDYNAVKISLTATDKAAIKAEARRRQSVNEGLRLSGRNNGPAQGELAAKCHELGAGGEMAVATYLGLEDHLYKDLTPIRGSADLPPNIDVKTRARHYYDLLVQLDDCPRKTFVLVTVENKEVLMHGWIHGEEAMKKEYVKEYVKGRPCYSIPKEKLSPMLSLKEYVMHALL